MFEKGWSRLLFGAVGAALAVSTHALAQEGAGSAAKAPAAPSPPAASEIALPSQTTLSQAHAALARMREILTRVLKLAEEARAERDVIKLNCVNEKLTAVKGLLRISEQADVALEEALASRQHEVAAHEFEKISIALRKCEQLLGEAEACIGELTVYTGETTVEMVVDGGPQDDPTRYSGRLDFITRPPPASPYQ